MKRNKLIFDICRNLAVKGLERKKITSIKYRQKNVQPLSLLE